MLAVCPHCGRTVSVDGLGRKPLVIPVINIYDALKTHGSVIPAADSLGCSRSYIYKALKAEGKTPADVIRRLKTKDAAMQYSGEDNGRV